MPTRTIDLGGARWTVTPSGFVTANDRDEFGLVFTRAEGDEREVRVTRYSPTASRDRERSLAELTDERLGELFAASQPSATSPEAGYYR